MKTQKLMENAYVERITAQCLNCSFIINDRKVAEEFGKRHAERTGHQVVVTQQRTYDISYGQPLNNKT